MRRWQLMVVSCLVAVSGWWTTRVLWADSPETIDTFSAYILCKGIMSDIQENISPITGETSVTDSSRDFEQYYKIENGTMVEGTTDKEIIGKKILDLTDTYIDLPQADFRISRVDGSIGHAIDGGLIKSHYKIDRPGLYTNRVDFNIECRPVSKIM